MVVIFGTTSMGIAVYKNFFNEERELVFYDNDRRKWGGEIEHRKIITLEKLIDVAKKKENVIVIAGENPSMSSFIKDLEPKAEVFKIADGGLQSVNYREIDNFLYDNADEVGIANVHEYQEISARWRENDINAYRHAEEYIKFKKTHIRLPEISSIEFTNNCNLQCPNCPNSYLTFHKGYISDEVFYQALKYIPPYDTDTIAVHCMGEPLLHPKLITYLEELAKINVNICLSTNGILLDGELALNLLNVFTKLKKGVLYVSFHTKKSVENWFKFLSLLEKCEGHNVSFYGQVLEHNRDDAYKWLRDIGVKNADSHPYIRYITSHSWGGNVKGKKRDYLDIEVKNRIRNCFYLRKRKVAVMWDGTLRGCCFDSNAAHKCGNIFRFEESDINPYGYELCKHCDPDWITNYQ